jgi:hypothetical protein
LLCISSKTSSKQNKSNKTHEVLPASKCLHTPNEKHILKIYHQDQKTINKKQDKMNGEQNQRQWGNLGK